MGFDPVSPVRTYAPGIGDAVADRTINRKLDPVTRKPLRPLKPDERDTRPYVRETWEEVAKRVAEGNLSLSPLDNDKDFLSLHRHLRQASILMSGRHLQHGDSEQHTRNMEVFTNCSTAAATFLSFYLLLNGSGVGRSYDDEMMVVDYRKMPRVFCSIRDDHPDVVSGEIKAPVCSEVFHRKDVRGHYFTAFHVPDSREGWAQAIEKIETMTAAGTHRDHVLVLDFSGVRERGAPIGGMQDRPASGPGPLMAAIAKLASLRDAGYEPWRAAMHADHYMAECVLVGGARRAARMATKFWRDRSVLEFIDIKRGGGLWSSNNSVMVDKQFWDHVEDAIRGLHSYDPIIDADQKHAHEVFEALCKAAYFDQTGEPGLINVDRLVWDGEGTECLLDGLFAESKKYKLDPATVALTKALAQRWAKCQYKVITNPCGEIVLMLLGGYCVIADVVPYHAGMALRKDGHPVTQRQLDLWDMDAEDAFKTATRALIRTNLMESLYGKEVARTNRIGVGMTGIHEYAWARFGYGWKDLVDEEKSKDFWLMLARFKRAVQREAHNYSKWLGVAVPHTNTTMKPAGTTSKLFGLTESGHLPSMREYVRWVQFRYDDPLVEEYRAKGYPIRHLENYPGTTIVGFPTQHEICRLGMGDKLVTAAEATPEEQYEWLRLLEKYWIVGVEIDGYTPLEDRGNQVSYTLKYDPKKVSFEEFKLTLLEGQSTIRACSVMPQGDTSAYEYLPEQPVSKAEFELIAAAIERAGKEDVAFEHVDCSSGACPIDFRA